VRGRRLIPATVALLLAAALAPGVASARPGDKPIELYQPAEGAKVADATHGLNVDFTCPVYHQYDYDQLTAPTEGYHVILSTADAVDEHGLLLDQGRIDTRDAVSSEFVGGHCNAVDDDAGNGLLPPEPGTYHWQAYRECATYLCPGGVEVSEVWPVIVGRTVCSADRATLATVTRALTAARRALAARRTAARRARVARLSRRAATLRTRLRVVHHCKA
jgi:hypothetical protein